TWENRKLKVIVTICTSLLMVACVMPMSKPAKKTETKEPLNVTSGNSVSKKADKEPLNLDFHDTDIIDVLQIISKATGQNIMWDPVIKGRKVTMVLKDIPGDEALDLVLKETGLEKKNFVDNIVWVTTKEKMKQIVTSKDNKTQTKNDKIHLNMTFPDTEITKILMMISEAAVVNMIWDPAIKGKKVSRTFKDIPWDEALDLVLKETGLKRKIVAGNIIWIATSEKIKNEEANLKGLDNGEEKKVLQNSSNEPRKIIIDFDNVDINILIKFISEFTGKNFIVDEDVKGKVTVMTPTKLTIDEAYELFESVLEINGYAAIPTETAIKIVKAEQEK
ncbi:MAG: hypothetical protein GX654_11365, partial [Desulfatiglans sp.]|nr:hypothetical protein [Desulfatiglans sp.]